MEHKRKLQNFLFQKDEETQERKCYFTKYVNGSHGQRNLLLPTQVNIIKKE